MCWYARQPVVNLFLDSPLITVLGIPVDENSSYLKGCSQGPQAIRDAFHSPSSNYCAEDGTDLSNHPLLTDAGDLEVANDISALKRIESSASQILERGECLISLGGDHSITSPLLAAYEGFYESLNVLHLDAHPDLYDELDGNRNSHACPFARTMERGNIGRLVQVGIRTMNPHQRKQADRFGVEIITASAWQKILPGQPIPLEFDGPIYLSLDLDVLDPAFAPGVSHHEPGGATTRQVLELIQQLPNQLVGADIVELNPTRDPLQATAMVGAKFLKEITTKMLQSR